jgi:predicted kinase
MNKIVPSQPLLIMLYGYPGAGKSYVARQLAASLSAAHVQGERIRHDLFSAPRYDRSENEAVTNLMEYMTQEFLGAGMSVIYDTSVSRAAQRQSLRNLARKYKCQPLVIWLQIDSESAYLRTQRRDRRKSDDRYSESMDRKTFDAIIGNMQNPTNAEDYVVVSGKHVFNTQLSAILKKLNDMNMLQHIDDLSSGLAKPGLVNLIPDPSAGRVDLNRRRNIVIR